MHGVQIRDQDSKVVTPLHLTAGKERKDGIENTVSCILLPGVLRACGC